MGGRAFGHEEVVTIAKGGRSQYSFSVRHVIFDIPRSAEVKKSRIAVRGRGQNSEIRKSATANQKP